MVVYCASDLLWATKIKSTADALGVPCRPVRSLQMLEDRLQDSPVRALIVDLENTEVALPMIERARARRGAAIHVVAFGPHVSVEALTAARAAGADTVLTRGAFHRSLPELLTTLGKAQPGEPPNPHDHLDGRSGHVWP
jgi:hypothetical protein